MFSSLIHRFAALAVVPLLAAAVLQGVAAAEPDTGPPTLDWRACGDGVECAELPVPADWAHPRDQQATIGLGKLPARDQATKRGALLVNLGGPGPGVPYLPQFKGALTDLTQWFDVVLFDPRGFGASSAVTCPTPSPLPLRIEWAFGSEDAYTTYAEQNRGFAADCATAIGPLVLNAWQVAHDMDAVRAALGQQKLDFYGNSYGTVFGQAYAEVFGNRIGRMYLDSVDDHTRKRFVDWITPNAVTDEANLQRFADWCARDARCALHDRDLLAVWDGMLAKATQQPIPAPGAGPGATVTAASIVSSSFIAGEATWPELAKAIAAAEAGDATLFATQRRGAPDPALSRFMLCADFPYDTRYGEIKQVEHQLRAGPAPRIGWRQAWIIGMHCAGIPRSATFPPHPLRAGGVPPILLVNGQFDHVTPPEGAENVAAQLPGSRLVGAAGHHAQYLGGRNRCVRDTVHRYLSAGELPAAGAYCAA